MNAATTVVDALATDSWESTRAAVTEIWARTLPSQAALIDAELLSTRTEARVARDHGDFANEQRLINLWQSRLAGLVTADPSAVAELQKLHTSALVQSAVATDHGTIYQAQRDIVHTDNRVKYGVRIGRFNLGMGNLAILLAVLLGGTTGAVLWSPADPMEPIVGTWHKELGTIDAEVDFTSTVDLSVTANGDWTFKVSSTGRGSDGSMSGMDILCNGLVSPLEDGFEFRTSSEAHSTWGDARDAWSDCAERFTSTVSDDGRTLRTLIDGQTMELTRTG